ncbi:dnaJ homolog subfamily C member 9-like [Osmerus eperlanus]|uniref:dnaJ homolog subfamily C member 9-like n=1 Tax=Osmerus eperlanus TaxID=29151 RepID=UPI002E10F2DE
MGLFDQCRELFKTACLYEVLGITKKATDAEIRRSYYKVSLQVHPDRAPEDPGATEKFQVLGKLYAVLSDKEQRRLYDEQGAVDEGDDLLTHERCWEEYWRLLFPKITVQDIQDFERTYKGSEEEREDVMQLYKQHQGQMVGILASALCCSQEDESRFADIIHAAIQAGEAPSHPAFTQEDDRRKQARKQKADEERKEAEEMQREMGLRAEGDSLVMMLQQRQKLREQSFLSDLEAKYSKKGAKK